MKRASRNLIVVPPRSDRRFYGHGVPRVDLEQLAGKLIVVEGADGSGRSTQIAMLVEWLEGSGHATTQVGLKRSTLVSEELVQRNFAKNLSLDYWESGMDTGLSRDMFDSFMQYQRAMEKTFRHLQTTYGFTIVDGMRSAEAINNELRKKITAILAGK